VNDNYDEGKIIFQAKCSILPTDNYEDLAKKIHALEYEYFPKVVEEILH
jgi:phosphoribosylglycinamide formyltransferase-1